MSMGLRNHRNRRVRRAPPIRLIVEQHLLWRKAARDAPRYDQYQRDNAKPDEVSGCKALGVELH